MKTFKHHLNEQLYQLTEISLLPNDPEAQYLKRKQEIHTELSRLLPAIHQAASSIPFKIELQSADKWHDNVPKDIHHYTYKSGLDALHMTTSNAVHFKKQFVPLLADYLKISGNRPIDEKLFQKLDNKHDDAFGEITSLLHSHIFDHARQIDPKVTESDVTKYIMGIHLSYLHGMNPRLMDHHSQLSDRHHIVSKFHYMGFPGTSERSAPPFSYHSILTTPEEYLTPGHPLEFASKHYGWNPNSPGGGVHYHEET